MQLVGQIRPANTFHTPSALSFLHNKLEQIAKQDDKILYVVFAKFPCRVKILWA